MSGKSGNVFVNNSASGAGVLSFNSFNSSTITIETSEFHNNSAIVALRSTAFFQQHYHNRSK